VSFFGSLSSAQISGLKGQQRRLNTPHRTRHLRASRENQVRMKRPQEAQRRSAISRRRAATSFPEMNREDGEKAIYKRVGRPDHRRQASKRRGRPRTRAGHARPPACAVAVLIDGDMVGEPARIRVGTSNRLRGKGGVARASGQSRLQPRCVMFCFLGASNRKSSLGNSSIGGPSAHHWRGAPIVLGDLFGLFSSFVTRYRCRRATTRGATADSRAYRILYGATFTRSCGAPD